MESLNIVLPPPSWPLKRQIGVSIDGLPLSPIPISRSVSNTSQLSDTCEEKTRKQLLSYVKKLHESLTRVNNELHKIRSEIKRIKLSEAVEFIKQLTIKEKEQDLIMKKLRQTESLIKSLRDE